MKQSPRKITHGLVAIFSLFLISVATVLAQTLPTPKDEEVVALPAFAVTENKDVGYLATNAFSGTRIATSSMEIPQSIGVVNRELIEDIGAQSVVQAARYISGVSFGNNNSADFNLIRGLIGRGTNIDGFGETGEINTDIVNVERIEIIKGPIGLLINGSTGGSINQITKSPLAKARQNVRLQVGRYNSNRAEFDTTGPVTSSGALLYRVVGAYQDSEGFRTFTRDSRLVLAPSVSYRFSQSAEITVKFEAIDDDWGHDQGLFINPATNKLIDIPRDRSLHEGDPINYRRETKYRLFTQLTARFSPHWSTRLALRGHWSFVDRAESRPNGQAMDAAGNIPRTYVQAAFDWFNGAIQNDYIGDFEVGPTKHKALLGWEFGRYTAKQSGFLGDGRIINAFNPVYGQKPTGVAPLSGGLFDAKDRNNTWKVLARDQMSLFGDKLILVGGYYQLYNETKNVRKQDQRILASSNHTPGAQAGVVYRLTPDYSLYYGYNDFEGVVPGGTDVLGNPFRAPVRSQDEFGLKGLFLNQRVSVTFAVFDILQDGLLVNDPLYPGYNIQRGIETSKGWEIDFNAAPNDNVQLIASYSDTKARQVTGLRVFNSPKNQANVFGLYRFTSGPVKGLALGAGANHVSARSGDNADTFELGAYTVVNTMARYQKGSWRYTLNIDNLLDEKYEPNSAGRNNVYIGDPLNYKLSVDYTF